MKKLTLIAVLVSALTAAFATSAFAAAPTTPATPVPGSGFGYGAGNGVHAPGTGLAQGPAWARAAAHPNGPATVRRLQASSG